MTNTDFDLSDFDAEDTADMTVNHPITGEPTTWKITFAGPGHPLTIERINRETRQRLRDDREREEALANGRKWQAGEKTPDDLRAENVASIVDRIVTWTPVRINGEDLPFTRDNAVKLFGDPKKGRLFKQALDFLTAEKTFTKRSTTAA